MSYIFSYREVTFIRICISADIPYVMHRSTVSNVINIPGVNVYSFYVCHYAYYARLIVLHSLTNTFVKQGYNSADNENHHLP